MASSAAGSGAGITVPLTHPFCLPRGRRSIQPLLVVTKKQGPPWPFPPLCRRILFNRPGNRFAPPKAASSSSSSWQSLGNVRDSSRETRRDGLKSAISLARHFLPGGSWWRLENEEGDDGKGGRIDKKVVTIQSALRRMWDLVAGDRWIIFLAFTSLFVAALSDISIPHFLTASIFSAQSGETMVFRKNAKLLVILCLISGICSGLRGFCFGMANMLLVKRMREMLYSAILYQECLPIKTCIEISNLIQLILVKSSPFLLLHCFYNLFLSPQFQEISFFDARTIGDLTSRLGADCQQVSRVIGMDLNMISRNILQGTGALIYLFILSWPLALSTLVICSALSTILIFYGQYQKKAAILTQDFTASANDVAQEALSLIRTVRVYGTEKQEMGRYMTWLKKLVDLSMRQSLAYGLWNFSYNSLYHTTQVIAVLLGGISIMAGHISAEQLTKFLLYSEWLIYSAWWVADSSSNLMQSIGASEKVFQLMDLMPSKQFLTEGEKLQKLVGHIEFVNVSFHYPSRTAVPALEHINLVVFPNEVVAIVGRSGSGKSTLVNLLLRLYEPTNGQILFDGFPLGELNVKWMREKVGYVSQEPHLFRMDVSSNIRYGCTREINHEDVEWAAKQAFAHEFILSLPNGYGTLVDDALLSGGQKQRIVIARAILRDPTILILDEATSALDAESEHYVQGVLHSVQKGSNKKRTVIVIAHRLSTIRAADRIVVMDGGRIIEIGNHTELLHKDGLYAQLTKRQADALD